MGAGKQSPHTHYEQAIHNNTKITACKPKGGKKKKVYTHKAQEMDGNMNEEASNKLSSGVGNL